MRRDIHSKNVRKEVYNTIEAEFPDTTSRLRQTVCEAAAKEYVSLNTRIRTLRRMPASERRDQTIARIEHVKPEIKRFELKMSAKHVNIFPDRRIIHIASVGVCRPFDVPYINTKIFKKWFRADTTLSDYVALSADHTMKVVFELNQRKPTGEATVGCDIGVTHLHTFSDGRLGPSIHAELRRIARRTSASSRLHAKTWRNNVIGRYINRIDWRGIGTLKMEDLKHFRRRRGFLSHWNYPFIMARIAAKCEENGITLVKVPAANTSRRCVACGWVHKANRAGERFHCVKCNHEAHADVNAAKNILAGVPGRTIKSRVAGRRDGFYWMPPT